MLAPRTRAFWDGSADGSGWIGAGAVFMSCARAHVLMIDAHGSDRSIFWIGERGRARTMPKPLWRRCFCAFGRGSWRDLGGSAQRLFHEATFPCQVAATPPQGGLSRPPFSWLGVRPRVWFIKSCVCTRVGPINFVDRGQRRVRRVVFFMHSGGIWEDRRKGYCYSCSSGFAPHTE